MRKNALLAEFYAREGLEGSVAVPRALSSCSEAMLLSHPLSPDQSSFAETTQIFVIVFSLFSVVALFFSVSVIFRCFVLFLLVIYAICGFTQRINGMDSVELSLHSKSH